MGIHKLIIINYYLKILEIKFLFTKDGPCQKFPWAKADKNPIRHAIAYTLNMDPRI